MCWNITCHYSMCTHHLETGEEVKELARRATGAIGRTSELMRVVVDFTHKDKERFVERQDKDMQQRYKHEGCIYFSLKRCESETNKQHRIQPACLLFRPYCVPSQTRIDLAADHLSLSAVPFVLAEDQPIILLVHMNRDRVLSSCLSLPKALALPCGSQGTAPSLVSPPVRSFSIPLCIPSLSSLSHTLPPSPEPQGLLV